MKTTTRIIAIIAALLIILASGFFFPGCSTEASGSDMDAYNTQMNANRLQENQPTPTDIEYSLERYNLTKRAYWVNGQREKANALPCPVEKPLGYVILLTESGSVVGKFTVDGKVSSLNSFLTPDSEYYEYNSGATHTCYKEWLADVDGSYGDQTTRAVKNFQKANKLDDDGHALVNEMLLLTAKPVIYTANIAESDLGQPYNNHVLQVEARAKEEGAETLVICAKVEEELSTLPPEEKEMFLESYGITESGLNRLVKKCYSLLHLISYLTAGEKETRAWTIEEGTKAPQAAGKIHSDFEKGFIRAEIVPYEVMMEMGGYNQAKEHGKVRSEGKDYVLKDGDVVLFRFNV